MAEKLIQCGVCEAVYTGAGDVGDQCIDPNCSGHLVEVVTLDEPKKTRKTNPLRWLEHQTANKVTVSGYLGPEFTSLPKADEWLREHGQASGEIDFKYDLVRITVRGAFVEETVQRRLVYGGGS